MVLSLIYYYFPKYGGVYWFTGPVANIKSESDSPSGSFDEEKKGDARVDIAAA